MKKIIVAAVLGLTAAMAAAAPLNINTATEQELAGLEKIGPVRAKKIVEYRNQNGQFKTKADLKKFISDKEYEVIKEKVIASGATANAAAKPAAPVVKAAAKAEPKVAPKAAEKATPKAEAVKASAAKTAAPSTAQASKVAAPVAPKTEAVKKVAH